MLMRAISIGLLLSVSLVGPVFATEEGSPCDAHAHWVTEKDDDQGAVMKRCVCDAGWEADGPDKPCRQPKPKAEKKAKKAPPTPKK